MNPAFITRHRHRGHANHERNLTPVGVLILFLFLLAGILPVEAQVKSRPNVIVIITDDQGFGDLGVNGNPHVRTPSIDKLAEESVRFNNFYVSPVCAPTRASVMTGRYSLRTGVRDTYNGGATMAASEVTLAEMLKQANYKTGIFGKWHLGDNYPSRPNDQGFDESVVHLSGGMGQVGDVTTYFKGDSSYFDPVLWHNGEKEAYQGYCSDIFADRAIEFIRQNREGPFFCYLAFNAPHTPLQVPDEYYQLYEHTDPSTGFSKDGRPFPAMTERDKEDARKVYGMVTNIDDNVGRLMRILEELKIAENTLIIFMTDNGPQQRRYNAGMRERKGSVFRGGVRVPFYLRYPGSGFTGSMSGKDINVPAAHIDLLPTLAELCQVNPPADRPIDGKSLVPLIRGDSVEWTGRPLFFYWTRRYPELYNNIALQKGRYKLVGHTDSDAPISAFQLFDLEKDPYEQINLVKSEGNTTRALKAVLDSTYKTLVRSENLLHPQPIIVGDAHENPVILNRNDAEGERGIWAQEEVYGFWNVDIREGIYDISFKFIKPIEPGGVMNLETKLIHRVQHTGSTDIIEMKNVYLPAMQCALTPFYQSDSRRIFPFWVEMKRVR